MSCDPLRQSANTRIATGWRRFLAPLFAALMIVTMTVPMVGCSHNDDDTVGEKIDEGIEETGDAIEEAGDDIEDATDG